MFITQSYPTLCDPMDCSLPGPSVHGISQASILEWVAIPFSRGIFLTQGLNPSLLHCRWTLYCLSHQRSPFRLCVMTQITHIPVHSSLLFVPRSAVISFLSGLILPTVRVLLMAVTNKPLNYSALIIEICFWCLCSVVTFLTVIPGPTLLVILQYC